VASDYDLADIPIAAMKVDFGGNSGHPRRMTVVMPATLKQCPKFQICLCVLVGTGLLWLLGPSKSAAKPLCVSVQPPPKSRLVRHPAKIYY
jgi:hypothetical protein